MKSVRKISAFLLLAVFLFNTSGFYFVYKLNQSVIRFDIREKIKSGTHNQKVFLIKIMNPGSNPFYYRVNRNEFVYHDRLYDIVSESVRGKTTWIYCIIDRGEERLIASLERIQSISFASGSPGKTINFQALLNSFVNLALVIDTTESALTNPVGFTYCPYSVSLLFSDLVSEPPPPKFS